MHIFYSTDISGNTITLPPDESVHCLRVLRLGKGDHVQVIDGSGHLYNAVIRDPEIKNCSLEITSVKRWDPPRNFNLHIAIAPTKSIDRFEWFVEKAVEIGIDTITPLLCQRSERKVLKTDRLEKLIISSMKQARVFRKPQLNELTDIQVFIENFPPGNFRRLIAHCDDSEKSIKTGLQLTGENTLVLIGPEGDFTRDEISLAVGKGFQPLTLGTNRLRTETAGVVVCSILNRSS